MSSHMAALMRLKMCIRDRPRRDSLSDTYHSQREASGQLSADEGRETQEHTHEEKE